MNPAIDLAAATAVLALGAGAVFGAVGMPARRLRIRDAAADRVADRRLGAEYDAAGVERGGLR